MKIYVLKPEFHRILICVTHLKSKWLTFFLIFKNSDIKIIPSKWTSYVCITKLYYTATHVFNLILT